MSQWERQLPLKRLDRMDRVEARTLVGHTIRALDGMTIDGDDVVTQTSPTILTPTIKAVQGVPACRVYNSAGIAIPDVTVTKHTFNSERYDTDGMHSTSLDTGRITIQTAGLYLFIATVAWDPALVCVRAILSIKMNNTDYIGRLETNKVASTNLCQTCSAVWQCAVGEYAEVDVYQDSGGPSSTLLIGTAISPEFSAVRVG